MEGSTVDTVKQPSGSEAQGRGPGGRFAPGNRFGRGTPDVHGARKFKNAFREAITVDEVKNIARKLYLMALQGDVNAAKVVLERLMGRPDVKIEHSTTDIDAEVEALAAQMTEEQLLFITGLADSPPN